MSAERASVHIWFFAMGAKCENLLWMIFRTVALIVALVVGLTLSVFYLMAGLNRRLREDVVLVRDTYEIHGCYRLGNHDRGAQR